MPRLLRLASGPTGRHFLDFRSFVQKLKKRRLASFSPCATKRCHVESFRHAHGSARRLNPPSWGTGCRWCRCSRRARSGTARRVPPPLPPPYSYRFLVRLLVFFGQEPAAETAGAAAGKGSTFGSLRCSERLAPPGLADRSPARLGYATARPPLPRHLRYSYTSLTLEAFAADAC